MYNEHRRELLKLPPQRLRISTLGGEKIDRVLDHAPGNDALKVVDAALRSG